MRILALILSVLLTAVNMFRYNLPVYLNTISIFDTLSLVALMLACLTALVPKKNVLTESFLVYNILGCMESIGDELFFDPTSRTASDWVIFSVLIGLSAAYAFIRVKCQGKSLLQFREPPHNEWNPKQTNLKNHGT